MLCYIVEVAKNVTVISFPLLKQKLCKDYRRGGPGVLTDGEGREKGRRKMKERGDGRRNRRKG